ncbi:MAG TPA: hypothetical protein VHA35_21960 [Dongiaceae bacterium]|nr:hypothetical protein [Dongiaceae bacterium]
MRTILIGSAAHSLTRELADRDAHQLRDMGLVRAADGTLRLLDDPSVEVAPQPWRRVRRGRSWVRALVGFLCASRGPKTAL